MPTPIPVYKHGQSLPAPEPCLRLWTLGILTSPWGLTHFTDPLPRPTRLGAVEVEVACSSRGVVKQLTPRRKPVVHGRNRH
jgi:hypothetical protein